MVDAAAPSVGACHRTSFGCRCARSAGRRNIRAELGNHLRHVDYYLGPACRRAYRDGGCDLVPNNFSQTPALLREATKCSLVLAMGQPDQLRSLSLADDEPDKSGSRRGLSAGRRSTRQTTRSGKSAAPSLGAQTWRRALPLSPVTGPPERPTGSLRERPPSISGLDLSAMVVTCEAPAGQRR